VDPEADLSPPPPRPRSAWPLPPAAALAPPPPRSPILRHQRCPPPSPPAASYSPPEKMRCKEVSNFILEKWYENERLPHLSMSGSMNPRMMGLCVSSSLFGVYWQYYNPEKGVRRQRLATTLSSEELLRGTLQPFRHPVQNKHK
jgi:hypothetical protein